MRAHAHLAVTRRTDRNGRHRSAITRLRSEPPLVLRPTLRTATAPLDAWRTLRASAVTVALVGGAAGPVGGDHLRLEVDVGPGAALVLRSVAASVVLPGPHQLTSRTEIMARVREDALLVIVPGPVIAAQACDHESITTVTLDAGARLLLRDELILGRHGEQPGSLRQRLRATYAGRPLHDHELTVGPRAPGWNSSAVMGGRRAFGSILVVDPTWDTAPPAWPGTGSHADTALLPLAGPAALATALAHDAPTLGRRLDSLLESLTTPGSRSVVAAQPSAATATGTT